VSNGANLDLKRQVKDAIDLVKYLEGEHQLRRQGANYVCHCPWHDDQRPSLQINPVKQTWRCWPCEIGGDIFSYVMKREGLEFREALLFLAEYANIPVTVTQPKFKPGSPQDKKTLFNACAWAAQEFHHCLLNTDAAGLARDYLANRGITDESIEEFKIGFAPASFTWLVDRARQTQFTPEVLEACGLIVRNDRGWYERFRGRLIFPILDTSQRTIAFGGRLVPGVFPEGNEPPGKYINSPETRLFSKSETLYGLNMVRDQVTKTRKLTVVEGYTDVIAAWQVGLRNVVACLGVALNEKHIRVIKRFADEITLVLDGDAAGQKRANEILDLFVAQEIDLRILTLPEGADPFDFLMQNGGEVFESMVAVAPDAMQHKIQTATAGIDLNNDTHRANQALESILTTLARESSSGSAARVLRQDQILARLARKFQLDMQQIRSRLLELRSTMRRQHVPALPSQVAPNETVDFAKLDRKELELLEIVIEESTLVDTAIESIAPGQFSPGPPRELYEQIVELFHAGEEISFELLMLQIEEPYLKNLVEFLGEEVELKRLAIQTRSSETIDAATQLATIIRAFNDVAAESGKLAAISQLQQAELDEQEEAEKLEELFQQMKQRQGL
jgi:DNA primase